MIDAGRLSSILLWGAPGTGKTTLAKLLAAAVDVPLEVLSATTSGVCSAGAVAPSAHGPAMRAADFEAGIEAV